MIERAIRTSELGGLPEDLRTAQEWPQQVEQLTEAIGLLEQALELGALS